MIDNPVSNTTHVARLSGNLSLLAAICACLMVWSGIVLLITHPSRPHAAPPSTDEPTLPRPIARWEEVSQARRWLTEMLLFWMPISLGTVACVAGVATLAWGGGQNPDIARRALIALVLSIAPGCLCTLWYLAFAASPFLER